MNFCSIHIIYTRKFNDTDGVEYEQSDDISSDDSTTDED